MCWKNTIFQNYAATIKNEKPQLPGLPKSTNRALERGLRARPQQYQHIVEHRRGGAWLRRPWRRGGAVSDAWPVSNRAVKKGSAARKDALREAALDHLRRVRVFEHL